MKRTMEESRKVVLQEVDESVGGRVVGADGGVVLQLRFDLLGQLLPQFNAFRRKEKASQASPLTARHRLV